MDTNTHTRITPCEDEGRDSQRMKPKNDKHCQQTTRNWDEARGKIFSTMQLIQGIWPMSLPIWAAMAKYLISNSMAYKSGL